ncbi:MAG: hypothetical protein WCD76_15600 [Pyrinomonadaceae bacterium]
MTATSTAAARRLAGWTPFRLYWQGPRAFVDWCYLGERRLVDPFYEQTVERSMRNPCNLLFRHQTPIETLGELRDTEPGLAPSGFIFHTSRCGSTLISQMLAALPQNVVVSEAPPIDSVLRAGFHNPALTEDERIEWLRWMIAALGRPRSVEERHYFIKFDCWSILALPLIKKAFPGVPRIFLYREPSEVMVSQLKRSGAHMIPGAIEPALFDLESQEIFEMSHTEYVARVLAKICGAAIAHDDGTTLLLNYRQLPEAVWSTLPAFCGVEYTVPDVELMRRASLRNAKNPVLDFADDSEEKARAVTDEVRRLSQRWVEPLYRELEAARASQSPTY